MMDIGIIFSSPTSSAVNNLVCFCIIYERCLIVIQLFAVYTEIVGIIVILNNEMPQILDVGTSRSSKLHGFRIGIAAVQVLLPNDNRIRCQCSWFPLSKYMRFFNNGFTVILVIFAIIRRGADYGNAVFPVYRIAFVPSCKLITKQIHIVGIRHIRCFVFFQKLRRNVGRSFFDLVED